MRTDLHTKQLCGDNEEPSAPRRFIAFVWLPLSIHTFVIHLYIISINIHLQALGTYNSLK